MSNKLRLPVLLMVLTIIIISGFQVYWLAKNFKEEKKLFYGRTNMLFRETLFRLQASKLNLDSASNIRYREKEGVISMVNVLKERVKDTFGSHGSRAVVISLNQRKPGDEKEIHTTDTNLRYLARDRIPGDAVFGFLAGVDSLQDSITVKEIIVEYKNNLQKEKMYVPFKITSFRAPPRHDMLQPFPDMDDNKVTIGFAKPVTYQLDFESSTWFLLKKLRQPILVSCMLVSVTIFSFLLLYRNIIRQRKLTQLKNDFISNVTHELKTPIATVVVAIEALRNFNALDDLKRTKEYLDISASELQRLSLLVDKVLKLSMFEKKQIELKKEPFDLKDLVTEVINSMLPLFEKQQAKINWSTNGDNFTIEGDKLHLTSVIYNLLDNALKYSKEHPIINIQLSLLPRDILELKVNDNGIGIPQEYRFKIFTKFFRVPTGDTHNIKGYGLGLSYVKEIVHQHMGFIVVESEPGLGSTFIIKVPVKEANVIYFDEHRRIFKRKVKLW